MPRRKQPRLNYRESSNSDDEEKEEQQKPVTKGEIRFDEEEHTMQAVMKAYGRRLDHPHPIDFEYFPRIGKSRDYQQTFLQIRNAALYCWFTNRAKECTPEDVQKRLPLDTDFTMIKQVVHFLSREASINYGRFTWKTLRSVNIQKEKRAVVVIGAGAAGIAAATQLTRFGYVVIILEARDRIGGRVHNMRSKNYFFEAGCDTLRNLSKSPINTLLHQVPVAHVEAEEHAHIFKDGKEGEPKNKLIGGLYRTMRLGLANFSHEGTRKSEDGLYASRQQIYENMYNLIERKTLVNYHNYASINADLSKKREDHGKKMKHFRMAALLAERKLEHTPKEDKLLRRSLKVDIKRSMERFDIESKEYEATEAQLSEHLKNRSCKQYMLPDDYRNYNYFLGHEELVAGTQLEKLQFSVNTNETESDGVIARVEEGLQTVFQRLIENTNLDIRHNARILEVDTTSIYQDAVRLRFQYPERLVEMKCPFVISTLPLGVLKKSIKYDTRVPGFYPPLPQEKAEAIQRMGNGKINKVILEFARPFWNNNNIVQFGVISPEIPERGMMIAWSSMPRTSIMTTYYVGEDHLHDIPDDVLVKRAMDVLKGMFPTTCPDKPIFSHCTRWHDDVFAFGSGSFMSLRTEADDFAKIIEPLKTVDGVKRVYFAGEHTSPTHYGTLDGAWLSGLRVATQLANDHLGKEMEERKPVPPPEMYKYLARPPNIPPEVNRRVASLRFD